MKIVKEKEIPFENNKIVVLRLTNKNNIEVLLTNFGATILSILVPDKNKNKTDITLGYSSVEECIGNHNFPEKYYFGCTVGRYANRIANGQFNIDNEKYQLSRNAGDNHLHGGYKGLNKLVWDYKINDDNCEVIFTCKSNDGDEGYPGNLEIELSVSLNDFNEIKLKYKATSDKSTPVSLTNHAYFNLNGGNSDVLNHIVLLKSDFILEYDKYSIPTGKLIPVINTDFDLNTPKKLSDSEIMQKSGYDNSYVVRKTKKELKLAGSISEINNPINVEIYTTEPSLQLYTANGFDGSFKGKNDLFYRKFYGICMEAQMYPDSPNHSNFPNTIINPADIYEQVTIYKIKNN